MASAFLLRGKAGESRQNGYLESGILNCASKRDINDSRGLVIVTNQGLPGEGSTGRVKLGTEAPFGK